MAVDAGRFLAKDFMEAVTLGDICNRVQPFLEHAQSMK